MGRPSASYRREFDRNMKSAMQAKADKEAAAKLNVDPDWKAKQQTRKEMLVAAFNALQVGDSLVAFGVPSVVAKKNSKSVVTTLGNKYTMQDLGLI